MPGGRPSKPIEERVYKGRPVQDVALAVFERMEKGASLRQACTDEGTVATTVMTWIDESDELAEHYARARAALLQFHADELLAIADESAMDSDAIQRAKLRMDARKWVWSKLMPKRFGDRTTLAGDPKAPLAVVAAKPLAQMTDDDWEREHGEA